MFVFLCRVFLLHPVLTYRSQRVLHDDVHCVIYKPVKNIIYIYNIYYILTSTYRRAYIYIYSDGERVKFVKTNMVHLFIEIRPAASSRRRVNP